MASRALDSLKYYSCGPVRRIVATPLLKLSNRAQDNVRNARLPQAVVRPQHMQTRISCHRLFFIKYWEPSAVCCVGCCHALMLSCFSILGPGQPPISVIAVVLAVQEEGHWLQSLYFFADLSLLISYTYKKGRASCFTI